MGLDIDIFFDNLYIKQGVLKEKLTLCSIY